MLGYLDALIAALSARDRTESERLLAHPLARLLPEDVVAEATAFVTGGRDALAAPLRTMQLRHQTSELLRDIPLAADQPEPSAEPLVQPGRSVGASMTAPPARSRRVNRQQQMELPLSA